MSNIIPYEHVAEFVKPLKGAFISERDTEEFHGRDFDWHMDSIEFLPPPMKHYKEISLIVHDEKDFYESGGKELLKKLHDNRFDVKHEITCNKKIAQNPNTGEIVEYRHKIRISLTVMTR